MCSYVVIHNSKLTFVNDYILDNANGDYDVIGCVHVEVKQTGNRMFTLLITSCRDLSNHYNICSLIL